MDNNIIHQDRYHPKYQISTQYPQFQLQQNIQSPPHQTPITILSILKDQKIHIGEYANSWGENGDWLLRGLVVCINQLLSINDQYPNNFSQFLPEHMKLPMITIEGYIGRIIKYSPCSKECYITILMYIDRLINNRHFIINSFNIHRVLITCVLVGAKYLDDIFYNNQFYSQVGGISVKEINSMELDLLKLLSYDVSTPIITYENYINHFENYTKQVQNLFNYSPNIKGLPSHIPHLETYHPDNSYHQNCTSFHTQIVNNYQTSSTYNINPNNSTINKKLNNQFEDSNINNNEIESDSDKTSVNNKQNFNSTSDNNQKPFIHQTSQTFRFQPQPNLVA